MDSRDANTAVSHPLGATSGCAQTEHTLQDKSIAVQKGVSNITKGGGAIGTNNNPGDILEYTLDIQVSDFFAFDTTTVTDIISDGQHFDASFTPTLLVNGNSFDLAELAFSDSNYTVLQDFTGATAAPPVLLVDPAPYTGLSTISFNVSQEMITRGQAGGKLIGGCLPVAGMDPDGAPPSCSAYNDGATTFQIKFRTQILENFTDDYPTGDQSVDQGDILTDSVTVQGSILSENDASTPTGDTEADGSAATINIGYGVLTKSIYATDGVVCSGPCTNVVVSPNHTVTYRITYTLPNSDFEDLIFTDFLPRPLLDVTDPDGDGTPNGWTFDDVISADAPASGHVKFGPSETFRPIGGEGSVCPALGDGTPCISTNGGSGNNSLIISYGDFDIVGGGLSQIDLLFTVTVNNQPFADGLFHTNQVNVMEGSTNGGDNDANSIVQIRITEPALAIRKGIVRTNAVAPEFTPSTGIVPAGVIVSAPGSSCPRLTGSNVTSINYLNTMDSNITDGVDAGDLVTFAITLENSGHLPSFDVRIRDDLPAGLVVPGTGLNLCVQNGAGTAIAYTDSGLFTGGIELTDSGSAGSIGPGLSSTDTVIADGTNIAIITFDLAIADTVTPPVRITNTATLFNYSNSEGGPDFTPSDLTNTADIYTTEVIVDKTLVGTELNSTYNTDPQAVIGELVDYQVVVTIPEGELPNLNVQDVLDTGSGFCEMYQYFGKHWTTDKSKS